MKRRALTVAVPFAFAVACVPSLGGDDSRIDSARVIAVRADPAEAKTGTTVTFTALVAGPNGTVASAPVAWSFCNAPKPLTDDNVVSDACLEASSLVAAGNGEATGVKTPSRGCSLFGPETPPGGFRPRDPDVTGGYYQPLRVDLAGAPLTFELARIQCDLANASATAVTQFTAAYHANLNPKLLPLTATLDGAAASLRAIPSGARVTLTASWAAADAESYAYYDPSSQAVTTRRESMRVAWYSTGGALDSESTGRAENDPATDTTDGWSAPSTTGTVHLWIVLRDSRGGVDFASYDAEVVP